MGVDSFDVSAVVYIYTPAPQRQSNTDSLPRSSTVNIRGPKKDITTQKDGHTSPKTEDCTKGGFNDVTSRSWCIDRFAGTWMPRSVILASEA